MARPDRSAEQGGPDIAVGGDDPGGDPTNVATTGTSAQKGVACNERGGSEPTGGY